MRDQIFGYKNIFFKISSQTKQGNFSITYCNSAVQEYLKFAI